MSLRAVPWVRGIWGKSEAEVNCFHLWEMVCLVFMFLVIQVLEMGFGFFLFASGHRVC